MKMKTLITVLAMLATLMISSCAKDQSSIYDELNGARSYDERITILNKIATNTQLRTRFFSLVDSDKSRLTNIKEQLSKQLEEYSPQLLVKATHLDTQAASPSRAKIYAIGYSFQAPWDGLSEIRRLKDHTIMLQEPTGRAVVIGKRIGNDSFDAFFSSSPRLSSNGGSIWLRAFAYGSATNPIGFRFYSAALDSKVQQMTDSDSAEQAFRTFALLVIKKLILQTNTTCHYIDTDIYRGYQFGSVDDSSRCAIELFDKSDSQISLVFGYTNNISSKITQADVNCVLRSLKQEEEPNKAVKVQNPAAGF
jgi:hypothetical protein